MEQSTVINNFDRAGYLKALAGQQVPTFMVQYGFPECPRGTMEKWAKDLGMAKKEIKAATHKELERYCSTPKGPKKAADPAPPAKDPPADEDAPADEPDEAPEDPPATLAAD